MGIRYYFLLTVMLVLIGCEAFIIQDNVYDPYTTEGSRSDTYMPENLIASTDQTDRIVLSWKSLDYAHKYFIYRSDTSDDAAFTRIAEVISNTYADVRGEAGTTYYYKIAALLKTDQTTGFSEVVEGFRMVPVGALSPGIVVKKGDTIIEPGSSVYLDKVAVKDTGLPVIFTIENTGDADLRLLSSSLLQLSGSDASNFTVVDPPYTTIISPAESITFSLAFSPQTAGIKSAVVTLSNNDENNPEFFFTISAQTFWEYKLDADYIYGAVVDSDNNLYISGFGYRMYDEGSSYDGWIKKFDSTGVEDTANWDKLINDGASLEYIWAMTIDSLDNIYVAGQLNGDWLIKKYSKDGIEDTLNWNKTFNAFGIRDDVYVLAVDSQDNLYAAGNAGTEIMGGRSPVYDWWIKKFDSNGNEDTANWNKIFGEAYNDRLNALAIDADDNVYVGGTVSGDWVIKKYDSNGNEDTGNWNKLYPDESFKSSALYSIAVANDGSIYCAGTLNDEWVIKKFDSNGNEDTVNWDKHIDGNLDEDGVRSLIIDDTGNVYAGGYGTHIVHDTSYQDWWIKKYDSDGNEDTVKWDKKFNGTGGGNDLVYKLVFTRNNTLIAVGEGRNLVNESSGHDGWAKEFAADP